MQRGLLGGGGRAPWRRPTRTDPYRHDGSNGRDAQSLTTKGAGSSTGTSRFCGLASPRRSRWAAGRPAREGRQPVGEADEVGAAVVRAPAEQWVTPDPLVDQLGQRAVQSRILGQRDDELGRLAPSQAEGGQWRWIASRQPAEARGPGGTDPAPTATGRRRSPGEPGEPVVRELDDTVHQRQTHDGRPQPGRGRTCRARARARQLPGWPKASSDPGCAAAGSAASGGTSAILDEDRPPIATQTAEALVPGSRGGVGTAEHRAHRPGRKPL